MKRLITICVMLVIMAGVSFGGTVVVSPGNMDGWAFYGSPANTGDGIRMALRAGAALSRVGSVAGRVICAIPERRNPTALSCARVLVAMLWKNGGKSTVNVVAFETIPSRPIRQYWCSEQ